jgi:lysophospholipase L1-like esterase
MFHDNALVLFQGDSITDFGRSREEPDGATGLGFGYPQLLAGWLTYRYPERGLRVRNRAVSGDKITNLYARIKADILNLTPDVLSILVGVNGVLHHFEMNDGVDAAKFETVYDLLLAEVTRALPSVRLVLMEPFVLRAGLVKDKWDEYSRELDARCEAVRRLAERYGAILVPLRAAFAEKAKLAPDETWAADGIHPTYAGNVLIAAEWIKATQTT